MKKVTIEITTFEPMLGLCPDDKEIYRTYIASKAPSVAAEDLEVAAISENPEEAMKSTVFPRTPDDVPCFWDYQIRGYFKDSCAALSRLGGTDENGKKIPMTKSGKLKAFKKIIDGNIFVAPRQIPIEFDGDMEWCERPLRADTPQGSRVALARSEQIPAGAKIRFEVLLLDSSHFDVLKEWLDYGSLRGLGQWRNSGKGRFNYEIISAEDIPFNLSMVKNFAFAG